MEYKFHCTENKGIYCVCPICERDREIHELKNKAKQDICSNCTISSDGACKVYSNN